MANKIKCRRIKIFNFEYLVMFKVINCTSVSTWLMRNTLKTCGEPKQV